MSVHETLINLTRCDLIFRAVYNLMTPSINTLSQIIKTSTITGIMTQMRRTKMSEWTISQVTDPSNRLMRNQCQSHSSMTRIKSKQSASLRPKLIASPHQPQTNGTHLKTLESSPQTIPSNERNRMSINTCLGEIVNPTSEFCKKAIEAWNAGYKTKKRTWSKKGLAIKRSLLSIWRSQMMSKWQRWSRRLPHRCLKRNSSKGCKFNTKILKRKLRRKKVKMRMTTGEINSTPSWRSLTKTALNTRGQDPGVAPTIVHRFKTERALLTEVVSRRSTTYMLLLTLIDSLLKIRKVLTYRFSE